ncbi:ribonuclease H-like domain-containing protein [Tanacetum coccineum]|uniref:Ribonuclease H-like domain-containing protein n=1 Tax=Tanacetum coccineum TaxID=301880 RepID=A0ABQ4WRN2_9ASTR
MSNTNLQIQSSSVLQNVTVSSCSTSNIQEKTQLSRSRCMHSLKEINHKKINTSTKHWTTDSLKVDLVIKQNSCSKKEDINSETASSKSAKECSLNSETQDVHAIKYKMSKAKERCMLFPVFHYASMFFQNGDLKALASTWIHSAFSPLFGQDADTFHKYPASSSSSTTKKHLETDEFLRRWSYAALGVVAERNVFQGHMKEGGIKRTDTDARETDSTVQDDNSRSRNDTDVDDADIRPIYDEDPMAEEAIKSRFGGNDESKKMQKYILKQQFEGFSVSNSEGLHKGYDRFQSLLSQLEIHGAGVSTEDANQKFLRSLPSAWSQVSLIMRTKPGVDSLSFDDMYNNLRVFKSDVKGSTAIILAQECGISFSGTLAVLMICPQLDHEDLEQLNEFDLEEIDLKWQVENPQRENSSSYIDELIYSFFANQSSGPQLDHEDLEQLDEFDLEEMDLKWQVAMISMRIKKFYKKTRRRLHCDAKEPVGFDKSKLECYNCHKKGHFAKECRSKGNQESRRRDAWNSGYKAIDNRTRPGKQEETKALVTLDGDGVDWTSHSEDEQDNYAFMAYSSSGSDTKIDLDDKTDVLTYHKKLLAEAEKEKEELKAKVEKWHNSSKSLNILLNSQISARDKAGLGYGDQMNKGVLSYENEVFGSLFNCRSSDIEDSPVNNRYAEGMHAVPPLMTGIYIPSGPDKEIDDSQFTYGPKQSKPSESDARSSDFTSCESNSSEETHESMPETVVNEPTVVSQPKVWTDAPIIEEYESDSDDEHVSLPSKEQETPSFANTIY